MSFRVSEEVQEALAAGAPVVALGSTLISPGFPHPDNLEVARELERIVRGEGAVPATIGAVSGAARVGLDEAVLKLMATAEGVEKLSTRGSTTGRRAPGWKSSFAVALAMAFSGRP